MASAASAVNANTICANPSGTAIVGVNLGIGLHVSQAFLNLNFSGSIAAFNSFLTSTGSPLAGAATVGASQPGLCNVFYGEQLLAVTGPKGATGPNGAVGPTGGTGGTGGTGPVGNLGLKGAQGPQGGTGGTGGIGNPGTGGPGGPQGATGITGLGPTGTGGFIGDNGIIGPQGPTGAQGVTGTTGSAIPGTISSNCDVVCQATGGNQIFGGPGFLGNTKPWAAGVPGAGNSQLILTCATGTLVAGGADLLPADVPPGKSLSGVLESSFPNPTNNAQWIVSAVITGTSVNTTVALAPAGPNLVVNEWVLCRP